MAVKQDRAVVSPGEMGVTPSFCWDSPLTDRGSRSYDGAVETLPLFPFHARAW
jgi:hypothetical protein